MSLYMGGKIWTPESNIFEFSYAYEIVSFGPIVYESMNKYIKRKLEEEYVIRLLTPPELLF